MRSEDSSFTAITKFKKSKKFSRNEEFRFEIIYEKWGIYSFLTLPIYPIAFGLKYPLLSTNHREKSYESADMFPLYPHTLVSYQLPVLFWCGLRMISTAKQQDPVGHIYDEHAFSTRRFVPLFHLVSRATPETACRLGIQDEAFL